VRAAHAAGLASGGSDDGSPGPRPAYGPDYFAAYMRDPDGLRVEVVSRGGDEGRRKQGMEPRAAGLDPATSGPGAQSGSDTRRVSGRDSIVTIQVESRGSIRERRCDDRRDPGSCSRRPRQAAGRL
jgi:hypothetical protein